MESCTDLQVPLSWSPTFSVARPEERGKARVLQRRGSAQREESGQPVTTASSWLSQLLPQRAGPEGEGAAGHRGEKQPLWTPRRCAPRRAVPSWSGFTTATVGLRLPLPAGSALPGSPTPQAALGLSHFIYLGGAGKAEENQTSPRSPLPSVPHVPCHQHEKKRPHGPESPAPTPAAPVTVDPR